jgi:hypothetical protein
VALELKPPRTTFITSYKIKDMASKQSVSNFSEGLSWGERSVNLGAHTLIGECLWELPSVAAQEKYPDSDQQVYGATVTRCGCHTENQPNKPLNTYWRAEYYNSGCTAPPTMKTWSERELKDLFTTMSLSKPAISHKGAWSTNKMGNRRQGEGFSQKDPSSSMEVVYVPQM